MGRVEKQPEPDEAAGAPEWMVTFSDCMTLLLTFFVLLLSFSSFDDKVFRSLKIIYCTALPRISLIARTDRDAFMPPIALRHTEDLDRGSEKPTLERGLEDGLRKETESMDIQHRRVLLIPSKRIFWGNGTAISPDGHKIMAILASFLKKEQEQVVISENGPMDDKDSGYLGLPRAWAVVEYLTTKQNLDRKRFSISETSTLAHDDSRGEESLVSKPKGNRMLEIILLERSVCN